MPTLNVSLPNQLKLWITERVDAGLYASASDYLRDLIREDIRNQDKAIAWLETHLTPLKESPDEQFISVTADDAKARARRRMKE